MKRSIVILCMFVSCQMLISCNFCPASPTETIVDNLAAVGTALPVASDAQSVKVQDAVAAFLRELNGNKMPDPGAKLICREFGSSSEALTFVCSSLLLHPDKETFPYDSKRDCYVYRSECLQLLFKELGAGAVAQVDIRFSKAGQDVKAGTQYTIFFKKR